ncbi:MAG: HAD-IIB family hydrolase [Candidatus Nomurabacteria bacterium]|jgi:hydroxymethylpyrimidine pyrophosphatase-like HAD family hydrolase|nr:HAD-IIB family hydrolase [Candidatus Nomurabacteria bacterium]
MKKVLAFDVDQTLNVAKLPIPDEIAELLTKLLDYYEICPISGQKFEQFLVQIINRLRNPTPEQMKHLHLFVAQGTQYYRFSPEDDQSNVQGEQAVADGKVTDWKIIYNYPLTTEQIAKITQTLEQASRELGYWEKNPKGEIIENRISQVTLSALGQAAGTKEKYAWDPDHKKRKAIVQRAKELTPEFDYEIGGTTSINVFTPGMNKTFGMNKMMEYLKVTKEEILYFGDMTQKGGNDYPVVEMGIDTITVRSHEDTAFALKGIWEVTKK